MTKSIAVLATLDTKGPEAHFLCAQLERLGSTPVLLDVGVMGTPAPGAQYTREVVAERGGESLEQLTSKHTREHAQPVMARGATTILTELLAEGLVDGVVGLGGLQGTALCTEVMRALPYGFPKVMLSTVASGDTSAYVDVKDITMMFSVSDILGLNAFTRKVLAKAAGAAHGMALVDVSLQDEVKGRRVIGMTNLGVLYENGYGVELDEERAKELYRAGGRQTEPGAEPQPTLVYDPRLKPLDMSEEALQTVQERAEAADPVAMFQLGWLMLQSPDAPFQNQFQAATLFRAAADSGYAPAMANLGSLYFQGKGVPQDYVIGYMWILRASAAGAVAAQSLGDSYLAKMTAAQVNEAQARAKVIP